MEKATQTVEIRPHTGWFDVDLMGIWRYRDLVALFVRRNFVLTFKQTILGPAWLFINPLLSSVVYTVIFGRLAGLSSDGVPQYLFYLAGTSLWGLFSSTLTGNSNTFLSNSAVFGKVYFPRLVAPVSLSITYILRFLIQFGMLLLFYVYFLYKGEVTLTPWVLLLPVLILQCALLGMGAGLIVSALTTRYRDLSIAVGFGIQLWMYASPVVYPLSSTAARIKWVLLFNPMTAILENFRFALFGSGALLRGDWILSWCMTLGILLVGVLLFNRMEKTFADTI